MRVCGKTCLYSYSPLRHALLLKAQSQRRYIDLEIIRMTSNFLAPIYPTALKLLLHLSRISAMFLYHMTLFSTCLGRALALSLPLAHPLVLIEANSSLSALNGSLLGATEPNCESNFNGYSLNVASCKEAVGFMKDEYTARTYVQRNTPQPRGSFQSLTNRSLSCKSESLSRDQRPI